MNTNDTKGRGMILFIHNLLPFLAHHFKAELKGLSFYTLKLKGKETLLVRSFYRSPNSTTENNYNLNELLEKISGKKCSHVLLLGVAIAEMGDNIEFNVPMPIRSRCLVYAFCRHLLKSEKGHSEQKHNR